MFINWNERELHIKIVYYGPPLSGKTTNLEQLHARLPADKRTDLVSVKTREDRTLFFDFMQLELGQIKGLLPKFKLYTVPGQVYYEATRKLVLRKVDGLIFVADSSVNRLAANRQAMQDMWRHLAELRVNSGYVQKCTSAREKPVLFGPGFRYFPWLFASTRASSAIGSGLSPLY
jgi:mutual gliding-motility protein MglA